MFSVIFYDIENGENTPTAYRLHINFSVETIPVKCYLRFL